MSFHQNRIIGFDEVIETYSKQTPPSKKQQRVMAEKVFLFLQEVYPDCEVDLHVSRNISECLVPLLQNSGRKYYVYAESIQLGKKPNYYKDLLLQSRAMKTMREIHKDKDALISVPELFTPWEAEEMIENYGHLARLFGIEHLFSELKQLLKKFKQQMRQSLIAEDELYQLINQQGFTEISSFFNRITGISDLIRQNDQWNSIRTKHGKIAAKITRCLIKKNFVKITENRISELLFQIQLALLKG